VTTFVVSAGVLTLIAVCFLLWPLVAGTRREPESARTDRHAENVAAYRERLEELKQELAAGTIDPEAYPGLEAELGAALLADAGGESGGSPDPGNAADQSMVVRPRSRGVVIAGALLVPLVAIWGYLQVGAMPEVMLHQSAQVLLAAADEGASEAELRGLVRQLERRLARDAQDPHAWYMLGHGRLNLMEYAAAADAFETLRSHVGDDLNVLISLAQARFLADHGRVGDETRAVMTRALALDPTQPLVLEMLAIDAFNRHDFDAAAEYLERALNGPLPGARAAEFREGLSQARALAGRAEIESSSSARIGVRVALSDHVEAAPGARVFVIARETGGPPVPIAVRALRLADLPADFYLTDADAMQAGRPLAAYERIELIARLSQTGDAAFRDGDLEARSEPVDPKDEIHVALTIGP
jgi:cytochrome c-type biogenesis protein CcmH